MRMGEIPGVARRWFNGGQEGRIPPARAVGTCADFGSDWTYPPNIDGRSNLCGIDSRCFSNVGVAHLDANCLCELDSPVIQVVYSKAIDLLYRSTFSQLTLFLQSWFGPAATITIFDGVGLLPAMVIVNGGDVCLFLSSGTDTFQQLALQAMEGTLGPQDVGPFGTMRFWNDTATVVFDRLMALGVHDNMPLICAGHSYGAAVATLVAARAALADLSRDICLMTYGSPRVGDDRLIAALDTVKQVHMATEGDIVTVLPPTEEELRPFLPLIGLPLFLAWGRWRSFREQWQIHDDGTTTIIQPGQLAGNVLQPIIVRSLAHQPIAEVIAHASPEYYNRLLKQADPNECCVNAEQWAILFGPPPTRPNGIAVGGAGVPIPGVMGQGGILVGGSVEFPIAGTGGIVVGGRGVPTPTFRGEGGILVGGESDAEIDYAGTSCDDAGYWDLGVSHFLPPNRPQHELWIIWTGPDGYTVTVSDLDGALGNFALYSGTSCVSKTTLFATEVADGFAASVDSTGPLFFFQALGVPGNVPSFNTAVNLTSGVLVGGRGITEPTFKGSGGIKVGGVGDGEVTYAGTSCDNAGFWTTGDTHTYLAGRPQTELWILFAGAATYNIVGGVTNSVFTEFNLYVGDDCAGRVLQNTIDTSSSFSTTQSTSNNFFFQMVRFGITQPEFVVTFT